MGLSGPREQNRWPSFEPPENVLVLAPEGEGGVDAADEACGALLSGVDSTEGTVIIVSIGGVPEDRLAVLGRDGVARPDAVTVVTTGARTPSGEGTAEEGTAEEGTAEEGTAEEGTAEEGTAGDARRVVESDTTVRTTVVSGPGGITGISHKLADVLSERGEDVQFRLCFHSITGLLEHTELSDAFKFLHLLTRHVASVDGIAHFHMDPTAHDPETLGTVDGLFDTVMAYEDGDWTVR